MNKRRLLKRRFQPDKIYFREALEGERSRKPAPIESSAAKIIFIQRTCLFLGWIAIKIFLRKKFCI
jgi:hypothetical protein